MSAAQQRILTAAEQRMGTAGTVMRTQEQIEQRRRWGLSDAPIASMPASDIRTISRMFAGDVPDSMTPDDVSEFGQINELFEACC